MKSCINDLNLKTELPRYCKFDWLEMTYNQHYWAIWGRHWIKIFRVLLLRSHWHCWMWLTERDVPNEPPPGHSGLFKTAGFAGRQLRRSESNRLSSVSDSCSVNSVNRFNILGLGAKVTTHDSEGFLGNLVLLSILTAL